MPQPPAPDGPRAIALSTLLLAAFTVSAGDEREIEIIEQWPTCDYERLGPVEATDGRRVTPGGSGVSRRANPDRAEQRLIRAAKKLGAERIVLTQRQIQRDGDRIRYVELRGTAIGPCREAGPD